MSIIKDGSIASILVAQGWDRKEAFEEEERVMNEIYECLREGDTEGAEEIFTDLTGLEMDYFPFEDLI